MTAFWRSCGGIAGRLHDVRNDNLSVPKTHPGHEAGSQSLSVPDAVRLPKDPPGPMAGVRLRVPEVDLCDDASRSCVSESVWFPR